MTYAECICPTEDNKNCSCLKKYKNKDYIISKLIEKYNYDYKPIIHMFHICNYNELKSYFLHFKQFDIDTIKL